MHEITYLNCTLTVSSNQHIGLLEKKEEVVLQSAIILKNFFMEEAVENKRSWFYLKHEKYILFQRNLTSHFQDAFKAKSLFIKLYYLEELESNNP